MKVKKMTFKQWLKQYQGELMSRTGLELNDCVEPDKLKEFHKEGSTPQEIVTWWIEKQDLTDFQTADWENDTYNLFRKKAMDLFGYSSPPRTY